MKKTIKPMNTILSISKTENNDCIILTDIKETKISHSYIELNNQEVSVVFNKNSVAKGTFTQSEIEHISNSKKIVVVTDMQNPKYQSFFTYIS